MINIVLEKCLACNQGVIDHIPSPIHSYDYNKDGYVPNCCNECGTTTDGYEAYLKEQKIKEQFISNRKISKILESFFRHEKHISCAIKKDIYIETKKQNITSIGNLFSIINQVCYDRTIDINHNNMYLSVFSVFPWLAWS